MRFRRVALVHDWLFHMRGGEKVLEAVAGLFPDAPIFTLFLEKKNLSPLLRDRDIRASALNRLPHVKWIYQWLLPLLPRAIERIDLSGYDLVISSSHCVAKGVRPPRGVPHVCYCHTPMRYAWFFEEEYFGRHPSLLRNMISRTLAGLRAWDVASAETVTHFIANSNHVAQRIREIYGRRSEVIYPPLEIERYRPGGEKGDYYLAVSALVPYKKIDLAVEAFNGLGRPLWIVGTGGEAEKLRRLAGANIRFLGWVPDDELMRLYQSARALVFPGEEDFGIAPLEAQACGTPVIAYGRGGALETVRDGETGVFFKESTSSRLQASVREFERLRLDPKKIRENAERFSTSRFQREFLAFLNHI